MKISDEIKLNLNIVQVAFFFHESVSFTSDINSPHNITSGTCITTSRYLHYHLRGPSLFFPRTCIFTSGTCIFTSRTYMITSRTCIIASGPTLFSRNSSIQKIKTNERKLTKLAQAIKCPFWVKSKENRNFLSKSSFRPKFLFRLKETETNI